MKCNQCGTELLPDAKFCPQCGKSQKIGEEQGSPNQQMDSGIRNEEVITGTASNGIAVKAAAVFIIAILVIGGAVFAGVTAYKNYQTVKQEIQKAQEPEVQEVEEAEVHAVEEPEEAEPSETKTEGNVQEDPETADLQNTEGNGRSETDSEEASIFAELPRQFVFSSGAGGWATIMELSDDGTFTGRYSDSDMGDTGEGYPDGTVYFCDFHGKFSNPERVDDYTCSMKLEYLETEMIPGEESCQEGIRYISSDAYGFDQADEFRIYLPGAPTAELPEGFLNWARCMTMDLADTLPADCYGIYNVSGEQGFIGYFVDK